MYHSVTDNYAGVPYGHISMPIKMFVDIINYLRKHKFNTITLNELYSYLNADIDLPPNPIVITFDDGYLDNWVNVFPIMKKYEMKATIFIIPEFIDQVNTLRPTLDDVRWGKLRKDELSEFGFLSWSEINAMSDSGLVDIQSHSLSHTFLFQSGDIIDFHHPADKYAWLAWNKCPSRKYLWPIENQEEFVEFGAPIYSYGRALAAPQYFADESIEKFLGEYVKTYGGQDFFKKPDWREKLFNVARDYIRHNHLNARYESQKEYEERVQRELALSKEVIERNTVKKVNFLCWPGGAFNQTTQRIAEEVGYLATTKGESKNTRGADCRRIDRVSGHMPLTRIHPLVDRYAGLVFFAAQVETYRGNAIYSTLLPLAFKAVHTWRWLRGAWTRKGE
jgi:peptidoglycan/xylan/chitin deacetylase (PgdA/CDA1 family)